MPFEVKNENSKHMQTTKKRDLAGLCTVCGGKRDDNKKNCSNCRKKLRSRFEEKSKKLGSNIPGWMNYTQATRFNSGLCIGCGKVETFGKGLRCPECFKKKAQSGKKLYEKNSEKKQCRGCSCKIDENGSKTLCSKCKAKHAEKCKKRRFELKKEVMSNYGGKCSCCGEDNVYFLTIDHIFNDGKEHRKIVDATKFYDWLKKNNFPKDRFQILCFNCNMGKQFNGGICPHKTMNGESCGCK